MMMIMAMVTIMVNICDDDCYLVMKVILVKEVMSCDDSPVAMFGKISHNFFYGDRHRHHQRGFFEI